MSPPLSPVSSLRLPIDCGVDNDVSRNANANANARADVEADVEAIADVYASANPTAHDLATDGLMQWVRDIAALGARLAGSKAEYAASAYIRDRLTSWGISANVAEFDAYVHAPEPASVTVLGQTPTTIRAGGVAFSAGTPAAGMEGRLADLATGASVAGKIALIDGLAHYDVCVRAHAQGAIAVIGITSDTRAHQWQISPLWGSPTSEADIARLSALPAAQVSAADGAWLRAVAKDDVTVLLVAPVKAGWRPVHMPCADIPGTHPGFVLVGGHLCSWGPGATDNATGNAIMLEIARRLAAQVERGDRPRYGVRFCWWTGHEQGGYAGSTWYADAHWAALRRDGIAYINVDNVGSRGASVKISQNTTAELSAFVEGIIAQTVGNSQPDAQNFKGWLRRHDQYIARSRCGRNGDQSFSGIGLPTAQISSYMPAANVEQIAGSGMGWWWHTAEDTIEYVSKDVLDVDALLIWRLVGGLVNGKTLPLKLATSAQDCLAALREYEEAAPNLPELRTIRAHATALLEAAQALDAFDGFGGMNAVGAVDALAEPKLSPKKTAHGWEALSHQRDALILRVIKRLNPILHHALSDYEYDISRQSRFFPGLLPALSLETLDDDARRMALIGLRRKINRINDALIDATTLAREGLSALSKADADLSI